MILVSNVNRYWECEDLMLTNKPTRKPRQLIQTVPTYTIPEAAAFLAINQRTLFSWYEGHEPILKASGFYGDIHLLSYRDLEEAYRVYLLRERFGFSLQFLRVSMRNARAMFRSQHPLQRVDAVKEWLQDLIYEQPARGGKPRTVTSLGQHPGQRVIKEVADMFSERIDNEGFIFPWRFASTDRTSRPVSINPNIMSGRLVVSGTRIPVIALLESKRSGMKVPEIARDYGLDTETVEKALIHIGVRQKVA